MEEEMGRGCESRDGTQDPEGCVCMGDEVRGTRDDMKTHYLMDYAM